ncbi:MAG: ribonuclease III [Nitrospirae bacterium RBG_13_39_12]|nr:MAG: ribonuclease III [Nitrospirae bacterium RBG_13_39_12]
MGSPDFSSLMSSKDIIELEKRLGYIFRNKKLLQEALTHRSFSHENPDKADKYNERLEFLGDSVLGFVIVEYLFSSKSKFSESIMAKTKSYLVKESVLYEIAVSICLGRYLRLGKGEDSTGGRKKSSLLADAVEAVIGAVYLDSGYKKTREIILRLFKEKIDMILTSGEFHDFKTELQEKTQLNYGTIPEYKMIKQEGKEHKRIFTIEVYIAAKIFGTGCGKSKKEAETLAAKEALNKLQQ